MNDKDKKLGLDRPIKRRDFVNGMGIALSGSLVNRAWAETDSPLSSPVVGSSVGYYPPARTGLRGSHPGSFEVAHAMRDGHSLDPAAITDSGESYDLVVVGAGISGLAAAWYYQEANPGARVLLLDNHDDFGGHAKRNEFWHRDQMLLSHGGTINIENFNEYGPEAQRLIRSLGIEPEKFDQYLDEAIYEDLGLQRSIFFNRGNFGADRLVPGTPDEDASGWREYLGQTPLSEEVQRDVARVMESRQDYLAGLSLEQKRERLRQMSYGEYLVEVAGLKPESLPFFQRDGYWAVGIDVIPAWTAVNSEWPGTLGLGFGAESVEEAVYFRFPDGNSSIARLLVRSMIPDVADGTSADDVVTARFDYGKLDHPASAVRIRLNSTVVDVRHQGPINSSEGVDITYVNRGQARRVKTSHCILACYHGVIPHICRDLPQAQSRALSQSLKAPLVYTSVLLDNWEAFNRLGVRRLDCPGSFFGGIRLADPINMGEYRHSRKPEQPMVANLYHIPLGPGASAQEQWRAGREILLRSTFEDYERKIRDQMSRALGAGGFDPARDILAITVNRWPHGYAYGQNPETGEISYVMDEVPNDKAPWLVARKSFGRISIANSDAAANAMTEGAIGEASRAVQELIHA